MAPRVNGRRSSTLIRSALPRGVRLATTAATVAAAPSSVTMSATQPMTTDAAMAADDPAVRLPAMLSYTRMNTGSTTHTVNATITAITHSSAAGYPTAVRTLANTRLSSS